MNPIEAGSWWEYVGPGEGRGALHQVTSANAGTVTTWSDVHGPGPRGWSWMGTPDEFKTAFKPAKRPTK